MVRKKESDNNRGADRAVYVFFSAMSVAVGFLLGSRELLFGTYPMGLALLCGIGKYTGFMLAGLLISAFAESNFTYVFAYLFAALLRVGFSFLLAKNLRAGNYRAQSKASVRIFGKYADGSLYDISPVRFSAAVFRENPEIRAFCAFLSAFAAGIVGTAVGGFAFYDLFGLIFLSLSTPLFCIGYTYCTDTLLGRTEFKPLSFKSTAESIPQLSVRYVIGFAVLSASLTYSLSDRYVSVFLCAPFAAMLFTYLVCKRRGFLFGVGTAVVTGLACDPYSSPMFVISALLFCLLDRLSEAAAFGASLTGAALWCFYSGGLTGLATVFPSVALAVPAYYLTQRILECGARRNNIFTVTSAESDFAVAVLSENALTATKNKMTAFSEAFSSLSNKFFDLSDRFRRPQVLDLRRICDEACSRHCTDCRSREICWGAGYCDTLDMINKLAGQLHTRGHAEPMLLPNEMRVRCIRIGEISDDVNKRCGELTAELLKNDRTEIFAENYGSISSILDEAIAEADSESECDGEAATAIYDYLSSKGAEIYGAVVFGKRAKHITVRGVGFSKIGAEIGEIRREISAICKVKLSEPTFEVGEDCTVMTLNSNPQLSVAVASGSLSAASVKCAVRVGAVGGRIADDDPDSCDRDAVCGDTTDNFSNGNLFFYSLISDGMGTGRDAMFTSRICSVFLEKMLGAGNKTEISLRMLNSFIRSENSCTGAECSATVDLMELDLLSGSASFAKSGAAPTYIIRGGSVFVLRSRTLPIGIIKNPDVCVTKSEIKPDDIIVMVSDGVTQNNDECPWLMSLLAESGGLAPEELKDKILGRAAVSGSKDDMSAVVVKVKSA